MLSGQNPEVLKTRLLSGAGLLSAILASACCLLPLLFALVGVSGAWIGQLTALATYQPAFFAIGAISVGWGIWRSYGSLASCEQNCGTPLSRRVIRTSLWVTAVMLALAASVGIWVPLFI
jgi:mercuric ion transport protein